MELLTCPGILRLLSTRLTEESEWGLLFFLPHLTACGILVPRPGIKHTPPAMEAPVLNRWTGSEVLS